MDTVVIVQKNSREWGELTLTEVTEQILAGNPITVEYGCDADMIIEHVIANHDVLVGWDQIGGYFQVHLQ